LIAALRVRTWSKDGKYVYFSDRQDDVPFYRVRVSDRKLERLVNLADFGKLAQAASAFGRASARTILYWHPDISVQEIYALDCRHTEVQQIGCTPRDDDEALFFRAPTGSALRQRAQLLPT